jgi:hypothetical protein
MHCQIALEVMVEDCRHDDHFVTRMSHSCISLLISTAATYPHLANIPLRYFHKFVPTFHLNICRPPSTTLRPDPPLPSPSERSILPPYDTRPARACSRLALMTTVLRFARMCQTRIALCSFLVLCLVDLCSRLVEWRCHEEL